MLSLHSVTKRYGALMALDGVSLNIARGEFFGLLGPNGAGKSTLMSLVAGLRSPDSGTLSLDGKPLSSADVATRLNLGLVPQSIALYDELSAEQNLRVEANPATIERVAEGLDILEEARRLRAENKGAR